MISHLHDPYYLKTNSYKTDEQLLKRKSLFNYARPQIDLDGKVLKAVNPGAQKILDVGCGNGDFLLRLRQELGPRELHGIDISKGIMALGRQQSEKERYGIDFQVGSAENLSFADNTLDVVTSKHVLYHVPDIQNAVNEAYRCLRPGGQYLVTLNSKAAKTKLKQFRSLLYDKLAIAPQEEPDQRMNIELFPPYLSLFTSHTLQTFESVITIENPKPYVTYIDSFRYNLGQEVSDEKWQKVLREIEVLIQREIAAAGGTLTDRNVLGLFVAVK